MCGRTRCTLRPDDVPRASHRDGVPARYLHFDRYRPSYNVAPGSYMPVLRRDNEAAGVGVAVHCMKWGLVPAFTKKTDKPDFFKMFNARSESVAEKASFRRLLPKNRCLVAVDGFYEWMKEGSKKQPYYIHFKDGRPLVFAALYDSWQNSEGETLYTFTILTTSSSSALHWLHDRMPVILGDKPSVDIWLDDPSTFKLKSLLVPYENPDLIWYPVTPAIGKLSFNGPECIQQVPLKASKNNLISNFFSAQLPKIDKEDRETKLTSANVPVDLKEELTGEGYKAAVISDRIKKNEESDEEKSISNEAPNLSFQMIGKAEPLLEDNSAVASHLEPVKSEAQEGATVEDKSIKTESPNLDPLRNLKEEPEIQVHGLTANEELNQSELPHDSVQDKPGHEDQQTAVPCQNTKEGDLEFNKESPGKSATKRDYEAFSGEQKPWKHSEKRRDVKSCGKQGKKQGSGKSNVKNCKEKQSTLHFFFDGK